ncbi:hypothetical protein ACFL1W_01230 [Candidatus Margulisiibacteriota bacterium]
MDIILRRLRLLGIVVSILLIWNGVCDMIYGFSAQLNGNEYTSLAIWDVMRTAGGRPHWMIMMAQTAGWLYPFYALSYYPWWVGMKRAGFWLGTLPCLMLAYALFMIGGIQHAGWAFLTVLAQAKAAVGSTDPTFYAAAERLLVEHFVMGDLTALIAMYGGSILHAVGILSGKTLFPRWFIVFSPLSVLVLTFVIGGFLPAPLAGIVITPFGTWYMLFPLIASTIWLLKHAEVN